MHTIRNFFRWLLKCFQYSLLLWNDYDYDFGYSLTLLEYKLERTARHILKHNFITDAGEIFQEISHVRMLINQYQEGDFLPELMEAHNAKWGEMELFFVPAEAYPGLSEMHHRFPGHEYTEEQLKLERQERHDIYVAQGDAQHKCWEEIWSSINKNAQRWWD